MSAEETEATSMGCALLVFAWIATLLGGIAIGFWVLK